MADCNSCKHKTTEPVPYIVHEADMARQERTIKRLWILLILLIVLFVGSNIAWVAYESQFTNEVTTVESWADDGSTAIGNVDGEVVYNGG